MNHSYYAKSLTKKHTDEHISDDDLHIPAGNDYMVCNDLEKIKLSTRKCSIQTYNQVSHPEDLVSDINQWLSDIKDSYCWSGFVF